MSAKSRTITTAGEPVRLIETKDSGNSQPGVKVIENVSVSPPVSTAKSVSSMLMGVG